MVGDFIICFLFLFIKKKKRSPERGPEGGPKRGPKGGSRRGGPRFVYTPETEPNEPVRKITFLNSLILPLNVICTYLDYLWFLMILVQA